MSLNKNWLGTVLQGSVGLLAFVLIWGALRTLGWTVLPGPIEVAQGLPALVQSENYWLSWLGSAQRVFGGFAIAAVLALAVGLSMGVSRTFRWISFPLLEIFRPIPPLAWLPLAILFWPSSEATMHFLTFAGAFFPILINVLAGIDSVDRRYVESAQSLGATRRVIFSRILLPAALPSVFTGLAIAIGITWEVVIAAEMASSTNGLGYLTWGAYVNHSLPGIILGMLSIGCAGMLSSALMTWIGRRAMPWRKGAVR
jgi:NitT/TauT family transport system permease protein